MVQYQGGSTGAMIRFCHARTRMGTRCLRRALPDQLRCGLHGSRGGRPRGTPMHPNTAAALRAGRARWLQRMRLAKQQGLIERFPNGRRALGSPKLHPDRTIRRAQKIIEARMAKEPALRVVGDPGVEVPLTSEEQAAVGASKAAAARGEFASDEEVRAVWAKHGPVPLERRPEPVEGRDTAASGLAAAPTDSSAVTTAESFGEAEELLEELLAALLEAPNPLNEADEHDSLWTLVAGELSGEFYDRLDGWVEKRLTSTE